MLNVQFFTFQDTSYYPTQSNWKQRKLENCKQGKKKPFLVYLVRPSLWIMRVS
jgi:hypothetical protein